MATSSDPKIQKLMDETDAIDANDPDMIEKLNLIATKMAQHQGKLRVNFAGFADNDENLIDPSDAFACEGCQ